METIKVTLTRGEKQRLSKLVIKEIEKHLSDLVAEKVIEFLNNITEEDIIILNSKGKEVK